jgi:hypothetical protein
VTVCDGFSRGILYGVGFVVDGMDEVDFMDFMDWVDYRQSLQVGRRKDGWRTRGKTKINATICDGSHSTVHNFSSESKGASLVSCAVFTPSWARVEETTALPWGMSAVYI